MLTAILSSVTVYIYYVLFTGIFRYIYHIYVLVYTVKQMVCYYTGMYRTAPRYGRKGPGRFLSSCEPETISSSSSSTILWRGSQVLPRS